MPYQVRLASPFILAHVPGASGGNPQHAACLLERLGQVLNLARLQCLFAGDATEKLAPKKVVYGKKKPTKKDTLPADPADKVAMEEQVAAAKQQAAEEAAKRAQVTPWLHTSTCDSSIITI